jgi:membrane protein DedA with SNARE-associated domain
MNLVLTWLLQYEYAAMFALLTLCGVGLPLPEEVTLLGSGLLVGWQEADFWLATLACSSGILMGDSLIFGLGRQYGRRFLQSGLMQLLLPAARQASVQVFFVKHRSKALFLARFFPGVRIGVYAYAGSQRITWMRFICLDGLGVLISGPTSIWVGRWAALAMGSDRQAAMRLASERMHDVGYWMALAVALACSLFFGIQTLWRRRARRS